MGPLMVDRLLTTWLLVWRPVLGKAEVTIRKDIKFASGWLLKSRRITSMRRNAGVVGGSCQCILFVSTHEHATKLHGFLVLWTQGFTWAWKDVLRVWLGDRCALFLNTTCTAARG